MVCACNPSTVEHKAGGLRGQCQLEFQNKTMSSKKERLVKENVLSLTQLNPP